MNYVVTNENSSQGASQFVHYFEENEVVIKMIIKGRSPTMRHVSRTHKVALDWLFDSSQINLDPSIRITYVDTKNQFADLLTKGSFTRDQWYNFFDGPKTSFGYMVEYYPISARDHSRLRPFGKKAFHPTNFQDMHVCGANLERRYLGLRH